MDGGRTKDHENKEGRQTLNKQWKCPKQTNIGMCRRTSEFGIIPKPDGVFHPAFDRKVATFVRH